MLNLYSDGSSDGKRGGISGFGWVLTLDHQLLACGYGSLVNSTNNLAELAGAYHGLEYVQTLEWVKCPIFLVSDSQYTLGFAKGITKAKVNKEETDRLTEISKRLNIITRWVRGHGIPQNKPWAELPIDAIWNHWADKLSVNARKKQLAAHTHLMVKFVAERMYK